MHRFALRVCATVLALCAIVACGDGISVGSKETANANVAIGLATGFSATLVADKLTNPFGIAFAPDGSVTLCDAGAGQVVRVKDDGTTGVHIADFATEYWKPAQNADGVDRFRLGPIGLIWLPGDAPSLIVSDSGLADGADVIRAYGAESASADEGAASNPVGPTTQPRADIDKGEANYCGFSLSRDNKTVYMAGQGADAKSWVMAYDVASKRLSPLLSADDNGISTNSPQDTMPWGKNTLLVLYSGAYGKADGLLVEWDLGTKKPLRQWSLPGLVDPISFDRIPGTDELVIVDVNWALTKVQKGTLSRVSLPLEGGAASVAPVATGLDGPLSCRFAPVVDGKFEDRTLYVTQFGPEFDKPVGSLIAVRGF